MRDITAAQSTSQLKSQERNQRGDCAIGIIQCIDGRISIPHLIDQSASVWETAADILQLEHSPIDGSLGLKSKRLQRAIVERAQNPEKPHSLRFSLHTQASQHAC